MVMQNKLIDQKEADSLFKDIQKHSSYQQSSCCQVENQIEIYQSKQIKDHIEENQQNQKSQDLKQSECAFDNQEGILGFQDPAEAYQNDEEFVDIIVPKFLTKSREYVEKSQSINSNYPILCFQNQNFKDEIIDQNEHTNTNENSQYQNKQKKYSQQIQNTCEGITTQEQMITSPKQSPETNRLMISPKRNFDSISAVSREGTRQKQLIGKLSYQKSLGIDDKQLKKIQNQVKKQSDIYQIYKDIIFLKKAMMIILSKEQLAAIQIVGCSNEFLDIDHNDKNQNITEFIKKNRLSHFQQNVAISENFDLQQEFIKNFYQKCKDNQQISEIDKRILSSIVIKDRFK
ncbi:hypothetical protein ABPG73_011351 [Tetrahymena malaccensis]